MTKMDNIPELVQEIYRVAARLHELFPGRKFTPDGHMVGSLGEVFAEHSYELKLLPPSTPVHDAYSSDRRHVQIKTTQVKKVGLRDEPDHLLVLSLEPDGTFEEVYDGPGQPAWKLAGKQQKNGQRFISLSSLRSLMESVPPHQRLPRIA